MKHFFVFSLLFLASSNLLAFSDAKYGPRDFTDTEKWTAIVAAYAPEIEAIDSAFSQMEHAVIEEVLYIKGVKYQLGKYRNQPIVIFTTGISVSNAAMTVQMALDYFPIDTVLMMGVAGAINPDFSPGDISVPERWYFHDESVYVNPDPQKPGQYILPEHLEQAMTRKQAKAETDPHAPKYSNFGFIFPRELRVVKDPQKGPQAMPYFSVSPHLFEKAQQAAQKLSPILMPSGKPISIKLGGNGVTGSVFADNAEYRIWLQQVYQAQVTEMESAAVGKVCFVNDVDWLVIRSVSDLAGAQPGKNEENVFDAIASGTGTKFLTALLDELAKED